MSHFRVSRLSIAAAMPAAAAPSRRRRKAEIILCLLKSIDLTSKSKHRHDGVGDFRQRKPLWLAAAKYFNVPARRLPSYTLAAGKQLICYWETRRETRMGGKAHQFH